MRYLVDLGFDEAVVSSIEKSLPNEAVKILTEEKTTVTANINYLKGLGINNVETAFMRFYNMFLLDPMAFDEIFSKYDKEDLVAKLEKNIAIMEYL